MNRLILAILIAVCAAASYGKDVKGKVTYVAAGTIYTTLGTESGIKDSSMLYVMRNQDTIAVLRVTAVSSKSSSAIVVSNKLKVAVGDPVASVIVDHPAGVAAIVAESTSGPVVALSDTSGSGMKRTVIVPPAVRVQGRISAQYVTTRFDDPGANTNQPSFIVNLKAAARDIPLSLEMYGNYRSLTYGNAGLFSGGSINQSRLYRLSLQYNDGATAAMIGRFTPAAAPSVGYLDGLLVSQTFGGFLVGAAAGFQSKPTIEGLNTAYKKVSLFANYQVRGFLNVLASAAYTRNYFHTALDRELVSGLLSMSTTSGLNVYFNGDLDLRQKVEEDFLLSPTLTNLSATVSYPLARFLSLSMGVNVSRWYADYSFIRAVPDSFIDRSVRSGASVGVNVYTTAGVSFANMFTPRSSENGFGKEYSNVSSLVFSNIFSTGTQLRANYNVNANQYTSSHGMGFSLGRSFLAVVQLSFTYQRSTYTIKSLDETDENVSYVVDALWFITGDVSLSANYNRLDGFGRVSNTIFTELSYRF